MIVNPRSWFDDIGHELTIPALGRPTLLYDRMPIFIIRRSGFHDPWPKISPIQSRSWLFFHDVTQDHCLWMVERDTSFTILVSRSQVHDLFRILTIVETKIRYN